jgi:hypothetical protein
VVAGVFCGLKNMLRQWGVWVGLVMALLAGCASMSESECRVADWGRVGLADGAGGVPQGRLASYVEDCGKIGVQPVADAYTQGWNAGITHFCTPINGWRAGLAGDSFRAQVCLGQPGYEGFAHYLGAGLRVYEIQSRLNHNEGELRRLQHALGEVKTDGERQRIRSLMHRIDGDQFHLRSMLGLQRLNGP